MKITLRALRINYGLTQEQASKLLGVSTPTIISWENGRYKPRNKMVNRILKLFHVNYEDLSFCNHLVLNNRIKEGN